MKKIIFLVSCFFLMINSANAVELTCPEIVSMGEVINCQIVDEEYIGIKAKYDLGNEFIYKNIKVNNSWKTYYAGSTGFGLGNVSNDEKLNIGLELQVADGVVVNQDYLVKLIDVEVVNSSYQYVRLDNIESKVRIVSDDNTLKSLEISSLGLVPSFSSDVTSYKASVDVDRIVINAVASDEAAVVNGDIGEKKLEYGVNNFIITVTSARGNVRNYYLYITRKLAEVKKDSDFTLKSLTLSTGDKIKLEKNEYLYSVDVLYEVENIEVEAIPNSNKASVVIEKPEKLIVGENNIVVIVTAEDGSVGKYVIVVNRSEKLSNDATIKNLNIAGYEINFESGRFFYELQMGNEKKLDIDVVLSDSNAKYQIIGNNNLVNGSVINIQVVAQDGSFQTYRIQIIKELLFNSSSVGSGISIIALIGLSLLVMGVLTIMNVKRRYCKED